MPQRGKLIALEGADGDLLGELSGSLHRWLRGLGVDVEHTAEPTSGPVGALVQLHAQGRLALTPESLALLQMADRLDHLTRENGILSWLDAGRHVLCARYLLSSLAQLYGQVPLDWHTKGNVVVRLARVVRAHTRQRDQRQLAVEEASRAEHRRNAKAHGRASLCQRHAVDAQRFNRASLQRA